MSKVREWFVAPFSRFLGETVAPAVSKIFKTKAQREAEATARTEASLSTARQITVLQEAGQVEAAQALRALHIKQEAASTSSSLVGAATKTLIGGALVAGGTGLTGTLTDSWGWTGEPGIMSPGAQIGSFMTGWDGKVGTSFASSYIDRARRRDDPTYDDTIRAMGSRAQVEFQIPVQERFNEAGKTQVAKSAADAASAAAFGQKQTAEAGMTASQMQADQDKAYVKMLESMNKAALGQSDPNRRDTRTEAQRKADDSFMPRTPQ